MPAGRLRPAGGVFFFYEYFGIFEQCASSLSAGARRSENIDSLRFPYTGQFVCFEYIIMCLYLRLRHMGI